MGLLNLILKWAIPVICTAVLGYITKKLKDNDKSNIAMKNSMIILLRSQIVSTAEKYEELGYLPDYARSCIVDLFEQYKTLGGNHGVEILVDKVLVLPAIKKGGINYGLESNYNGSDSRSFSRNIEDDMG